MTAEVKFPEPKPGEVVGFAIYQQEAPGGYMISSTVHQAYGFTNPAANGVYQAAVDAFQALFSGLADAKNATKKQ